MNRKPGMRQVHIETFGCQMNEYDTELVRALLKKAGYGFTEDRECADVILMNTCAIRENAHTKVYTHLSDLRALKKSRPLVVGVLGCMAQNLKAELTKQEPMVDLLAGPDSYRQLPMLIDHAVQAQEEGVRMQRLAVDLSEYETYEGIAPARLSGVNAWIAVMRGCDNFCSFCVVPYTRGRERSREPDGILEEARRVAAEGFKQITLLGQNVNSYRSGEWDFARLVAAVADVPGIERVRFTSPHPKDFPPALLEAVAFHPKICKHIHLPVQSGNDRILKSDEPFLYEEGISHARRTDPIDKPGHCPDDGYYCRILHGNGGGICRYLSLARRGPLSFRLHLCVLGAREYHRG